ncbi:MAG: carbohydrate kinase [Bacteroidales bacterium]|nr:carbohydrate kinase [Bacteroidales bacterium]
MEKITVFGLGEIVWDSERKPDGRVERILGGAPRNFAHFAKELGADAVVVSAVGRDQLGLETLRIIRQDGMDISGIGVNELPTGVVWVDKSDPNAPRYDIVKPSAWDAMSASEEMLSRIASADIICWGSLAQRSEASRKAILALVQASPEACCRVFDVNLRQRYYDRPVIEASLELATMLKLNEDELPEVARQLELPGCPAPHDVLLRPAETPSPATPESPDEQAAAWVASLMQRYPRLAYVIYTCGADKSEVYDRQGLASRIPTPHVEDFVDAVGAGDSFTAAFATSLRQGMSLQASHARAVEVAAYVCTLPGADGPLPTK